MSPHSFPTSLFSGMPEIAAEIEHIGAKDFLCAASVFGDSALAEESCRAWHVPRVSLVPKVSLLEMMVPRVGTWHRTQLFFAQFLRMKKLCEIKWRRVKLGNNFTCAYRLGKVLQFGQNASEIIPWFHEFTIWLPFDTTGDKLRSN